MTRSGLFLGAVDMAANGVNLDALIPREDFAAPTTPHKGTPIGTIGMGMLREEFFAQSFRKPDFQRETSNWTPQKIVDLIAAFLDGDLIPRLSFGAQANMCS